MARKKLTRAEQIQRYNATTGSTWDKTPLKNTTAKTPTKPKTTRKTTGSGAAAVVPPKKKPYVPASKKPKQGNIGRTTTKYDTPKGKAKVAAKPKAAPKKKPATKKKVGQSGMGMKAYQNLNYNRRK